MRRRVELLEMAADGGPVTSCVIEPDRRTGEDRQATAVAAVEAEQSGIDIKVLRAIHDKPDLSTSQDRVRLMLGVRKTVVSESLARLIRAGWVLPGLRNQPYRVTEKGLLQLETQS